jgi:hypothetical protein
MNDELTAAMAAYNDEMGRADEGQARLARARDHLRGLAQASGMVERPAEGTPVEVIFPWRRALRPGQLGRVLWAERPAGVALVGVAVDGQPQIDICPPWCLRVATEAGLAEGAA